MQQVIKTQEQKNIRMQVMNIHKSVYEQAPYVLSNVHTTSQACIYLTKHILKRTEENRTPTLYVLVSKKAYTTTKNKEGLRTVIPGPDQGSYLNENTKASESTMQVHRLDS